MAVDKKKPPPKPVAKKAVAAKPKAVAAKPAAPTSPPLKRTPWKKIILISVGIVVGTIVLICVLSILVDVISAKKAAKTPKV